MMFEFMELSFCGANGAGNDLHCPDLQRILEGDILALFFEISTRIVNNCIYIIY